MEGDIIVMQDIFKFVQTSVRDGRVEGYFTATGVRPKFMDRVEAAGLFVSPNDFAPTREGSKRR